MIGDGRMYFKERDENQNLIARLDHIIEMDKISHAYIFEGIGCIDKRSFVESFVKGILCPVNTGDNCNSCGICRKVDHGNHEDIIYIKASGGSIKDADIVKMQESLKNKPFGDRHIVIIENSDTMTLRAQNRLLKTLEEPPGSSVIMLLSENMENLVQTIKSRCVKYRINYFGSEGYDFMMEKAEKVSDMALNREPFYKLKQEIDDILENSDEVAGFLDSLQVVFRNMLIKKNKGISLYKDEDLKRNIYAAENARRQIKEGVSQSYAMKNLLIKIGG